MVVKNLENMLQKQADEAEVVIRIFGAEELFDWAETILPFNHTDFFEGAPDCFEFIAAHAPLQIVNIVIWIARFYLFNMIQNSARLQSPLCCNFFYI